MSAAEAIAELERCAGTQFDPHVVRALVQELAAGGPAGSTVHVPAVIDIAAAA
jgi:HD-GYP domain-containing protein (c-di-GMP phosphodiesterase class II)